jgi:MazG family protein
MSGLDALLAVVARLRGPDGCPWDRAQTPASMARFVLEEAHELVEALDAGDPAAIRDELGDLLFTVALVARMFEEARAFSLSDAAEGAATKMIDRHPHVFGDAPPDSAGIVAWEAHKAASRPERTSVLDGVPRALPALLRAERLGHKARALRFDWPDADGPRRKLDEEVAELDEAIAAGDPDRMTHELGDVLLTLASLGRHLPGPGAEAALRAANLRFESRFRAVERAVAASGDDPTRVDPDVLERYWDDAKRAEEDA